jgi:hypothetical protein
MQKICRKYAKKYAEICRKYAENMQNMTYGQPESGHLAWLSQMAISSGHLS